MASFMPLAVAVLREAWVGHGLPDFFAGPLLGPQFVA